jgi:hypothetical protein
MSYAARVSAALVLLGGNAWAEEAAHDEPFIAIDLGVEAGHETEVTTGLVLGVESSDNNFLVSAAVVRGHGHTTFADAALGYYRSFHLGWFTPELGVEVGVLNEAEESEGHTRHHLVLLERAGAALLHHFDNHMFAGLVSDVNFTMGDLANVRGLFEVGYQL